MLIPSDLFRDLDHRPRRPRVPEGIEELVAAERPRGVFSRQLILGDNLDSDGIVACYHDGVLRLEIPAAEKAKPRKISVNAAEHHEVINA